MQHELPITLTYSRCVAGKVDMTSPLLRYAQFAVCQVIVLDNHYSHRILVNTYRTRNQE